MITRPTVFVLGAGSAPKWFFSGMALFNHICAELAAQRRNEVTNALAECGYLPPKWEVFQRELSNSMLFSVDTFLETRNEFLQIGKSAIAASLIPHEQHQMLLRDPEVTWYRYVFNLMKTAKADDWPQNRVAFVTINYDRSLEHFFICALQGTFGMGPEDAVALFGRLPLIHVYGQLGILGHGGADARPYSHVLDGPNVKIAAAGIKIIHEGVNDSPEFAEARRLLASTDVVCFLGFGYHPTNIGRIWTNVLQEKEVFGTGFGLGDDERRRAVELCGNRLSIGHAPHDALAFLKHNRVLR